MCMSRYVYHLEYSTVRCAALLSGFSVFVNFRYSREIFSIVFTRVKESKLLYSRLILKEVSS